MRDNYITFGINTGLTALNCNYRLLDLDNTHTWGFTHHFPFTVLSQHPRSYTARTLGNISLHMLTFRHPDVMNQHAFTPITPSPLFHDDDNVIYVNAERLRGCLLLRCAVVGISDSGIALVFAIHDEDDRAVNFPARVLLTALEERGPDGAATSIGETVLDLLADQYPKAFPPLPTI